MLNKTKRRLLSILLAGVVMAVPFSDMSVFTVAAASADSDAGSESQGDKTEGAPTGEKPDGEPPEGGEGVPTGEKPDGEPPEGGEGAPTGEKPDGEPPEGGEGAPTGEKPDGEPPEGGEGAPGGEMPGGGSSAPTEYSAVNHYTEDETVEGENLVSTGTDENAAWISEGATVSFRNISLERTSEDSTGGDNSSFYGVGAGILVTDGTVYVEDSTVTTEAAGGAGVFAYGDGTAYVADTTIHTSQGTSGGIHVAGGGTLYAWDLDVETEGASAAAIRSDRGSGTMVVDGGTYTSNGSGSPAVYTTADITVHDADLTATGSEAVCIEGLNTLRLFDCNLTGNMPDDEQNDTTWTVILYQSMSGDSEVGNSTFSMVGGTLTSENGGLFYTTNTECNILLSDVEIQASEDSDFLLQVTGNANKRGWGTSGANGSQCTFTGVNQELAGTVIYDSISTLDFYLTDASAYTGCFTDDETWAGEGGDGYCNVYIDSDSSWTVTGDSVVDALCNAGTITDEAGNAVTVRGEDGTVYVEGDSAYTILVASYSTEDVTEGAGSVTSWSDFEVERPAEVGGGMENLSAGTTENGDSTESAAERQDGTAATESENIRGLTAAIIAAVAAVAGIIGVLVCRFRKKK
ncbi:MAG: hypothetical protein ACI4AD_09215 [Roseburia sp.]